MSGINKMNTPSILSGGVFAKKMGANLYIFDISNTGDVSQTLVTTEGGVQRSLQDRFEDVVNVKDFGAKGDGETDDTNAFLDMQTACNFIIVPYGIYRFAENATISSNMLLLPDAILFPDSGITITVKGHIDCLGNQFAMNGQGSFLFKGEMQSVRATLFGVAPIDPDAQTSDYSEISSTTTARFQRMFDSLLADRENVVHLELGTYLIDGSITLPRCTWLKGAGSRRTVFLPKNDGWPVFQSPNEGCRISDIQSENGWANNFDNITTLRVSPFIQLSGLNGYVHDVTCSGYRNAIVLSGEYSQAKNIDFGYGWDSTDYSSYGDALLLLQGSGCSADNIATRFTSSYAPNAVVKVSPSSGSIFGVSVSNVFTGVSCNAVLIEASSGNIIGSSVSNINAVSNIAGTKSGFVYILAKNSKYIASLNIENVTASKLTTNAIDVEVENSSSIRGIVSNITAFGSSSVGAAIKCILPETAGTESINLAVGTINAVRKYDIEAPAQDSRVNVSYITKNKTLSGNYDLNAVTTPGTYYATAAGTVSNHPLGTSSVNGILDVKSFDSVLVQQWMFPSPTAGLLLYSRISTNGGATWGSWITAQS